MQGSRPHTRWLSTLGALAALALCAQLPGAVQAATRQARVRWQISSETDVVLYRIHIGLRPGLYDRAVEVTSFDAESASIAAATVGEIDELVTYYFAVSAVDAAGQESPVSNEIVLGSATCLLARCDDLNPCSVDACADDVCGHAPVADGSPCDDLDPLTANDVCSAGFCAGALPPPPAPSPAPAPAPAPGKGKGKKRG